MLHSVDAVIEFTILKKSITCMYIANDFFLQWFAVIVLVETLIYFIGENDEPKVWLQTDLVKLSWVQLKL